MVLWEDTLLMPLSRPGAGCARLGFTLMRAKEMSCAPLFRSSNMSWQKAANASAPFGEPTPIRLSHERRDVLV